MPDDQQPEAPAGAHARPARGVVAAAAWTSAASARRRCRSCCGWRRCAAAARVVSLLALDFAGVFAAIFTALWSRRSCATATWAWDASLARDAGARSRSPTWSPCCCSPARACTPTAPQRPGLPQHRLLALPGDGRGADLRAASTASSTRATTSSTARCSSRSSTSRLAPLGLRAGHRRAAARRRLPAPRGARRHRQAHRGRRPRAARRGARAGRDGRLHLADAAARQRPALARAGSRTSPRCSTPPHRRGHHRRPGLPAGAGGRARRPVPPARRARAHRAVDDGDPRPPRGVRARARRCRCSSCARRSSRASTTSSSARFDLVGALLLIVLLGPLLLAIALAVVRHLARPGPLPLDPAGHRRRAVRLLQVPHDARGRRPAARPTSSRSTRRRARCSRSATTRA